MPITLPTGINNRGQITGSTLTPSAADPLAEARGFLLARGVKGGFTPVDVPGAPRTLVTGLNDRGQLVGAYENTNATPNRQGTGAQPPAAGDARALAARMGSAGLRTDPWPPPVANSSNQTDAHSSEETTS